MTDKSKSAYPKLIYHPGRVAAWLDGKAIYPVEAEITVAEKFIDKRIFLQTLQEFARKGIKCITFYSESEISVAEYREMAKKLGVFCRVMPKTRAEGIEDDEANETVQSFDGTHFHALPFFVYIDSSGGVFPCAELAEPNFCLGNLYEKSFIEIWESKDRQRVMRDFEKNPVAPNFIPSSRLVVESEYLHILKHPGEYVNFLSDKI